MDLMTWVLTLLVVSCIVWYVVATMLIFENLRRRGEKVSFIWLRVLAPSYAAKYRDLTRRETGRTGGLFYQWVASINLTAVLILAAVLVHYL
jgi:hypothetical protein